MPGFWGHIGDALRAVPLAGRLVPASRLDGLRRGTVFAGQQPDGKVLVTEDTALTISAVWAAVRVISGSIGILPLKVYNREPDGSKSEAAGESPGAKLARNPNGEMTALTFWETAVAQALLNGNHYSEIERDQAGRPIALWPLNPARIRPWRFPDGVMAFEARPETGACIRVEPQDIYHVPGLGFDGRLGYSPVALARRSLGLTATAEQAGETFFAAGMRPGGVIEFPGSLQDLQKLNLKESATKEAGGAANFGKRLVMYGGMKYVPLSISPDDAQFLETRAFQTVEVARWFNLPPHMLRDLSRATFSNIEQQGMDFVTHTLLYWLTKFAQEFDRKILDGDGSLFCEHSTEALLKGDTIARYTAYGLGRQWGFLSANDIRKKENESPIGGGDTYLTPVNMTDAAGGSPPPSAPPMPPSVPPPDKKAEAADLVAAAVRRNVSLEICELTANAAEPKTFTDWIDAAFGTSRKFRLMGDLAAAGVALLPAHTFAAKWVTARRDDLNRLADDVTPKDLQAAAEALALRWSDGAAMLAEDARRLTA